MYILHVPHFSCVLFPIAYQHLQQRVTEGDKVQTKYWRLAHRSSWGLGCLWDFAKPGQSYDNRQELTLSITVLEEVGEEL